MSTCATAARARAFFMAMSLCLVCCVPARAGDVPSTALSLSLGMHPAFLDYPSLVFQFPQTVLDYPTELVGMTGRVSEEPIDSGPSEVIAFTNGDELGVGMMGYWSPIGAFVLSQRSYGPSYFFGCSTILQFGVAASLKPLRLGGAFRGSRERDENSQQELERSNFSLYGSQRIHDYREYAVGAGMSGRGASLDLVFEVTDDTYQVGGVQLAYSDTFAVQDVGNTEHGLGGAARFSLPLGSAAQLIAIGEYHDNQVVWQRVRFQDNDLSSERFGTTGIAWSAGAALVVRNRHVDRIGLSGSYARSARSGPQSDYRSTRFRDTLDRNATLALSASRHLGRRVSAQAGVAKSYSYSRQDERYSDSQRSISSTRREESLSDRFSWGVSYSWKSFDFATSMSTTLDLWNLFVALDARIGL